MGIVDCQTGEAVEQAYADYNHWFIYRAGKVVKPDGFRADPFIECGAGIHFFLSEDEARAYLS